LTPGAVGGYFTGEDVWDVDRGILRRGLIMPDHKGKYLKLLAIELEDLRDDLETLIANCLERMERKEITKYVCFENMAVLRNEILSIDSVSQILSSVDVDDYDDLDALMNDLDLRFWEKLKEHGFPQGPRRLIRRKLEKVLQYMRME
jgi:hypothetical protein